MESTARTRGVTLLELLVAVAVFGVVASLLYGTFSRSLASRDHAQRRAAEAARARAAVEWLERDLKGFSTNGLYLTGTARFLSPGTTDVPNDEIENALLDLTTSNALGTTPLEPGTPAHALRPEGARDLGDQARVVYRLEDESDDGQELHLVRYEFRPAQLLELEDAVRTVIARGIDRIDLRFFDGFTWHDRWSSIEPGLQAGVGPRVVEIRLTLRSAGGVPLVVVSGVGLPLGGQYG